MLEGFFKIYSKILANRMQRSMRHIQQPHQFGFTRGRGILEASRTVLDVSQHAKKHNRPLGGGQKIEKLETELAN